MVPSATIGYFIIALKVKETSFIKIVALKIKVTSVIKIVAFKVKVTSAIIN